MNKFVRYVVEAGLMVGILLCLAYVAKAEDQKPLPEVSKLRLIVAYQKAVMAKAQFDAAAASYTGLADQEIKANGYEEGTRFDVNLESQQVLVISPPKKPEPVKPAEPAVKK